MWIKDPKDPRKSDWSEIANAERQALEPLVKYTTEYTFRPYLLEAWDVNDDATEYVAACAQGRDLEQWRPVQRRRRDLQLQPLGRKERRRQFDAGPPRHAVRRQDRQAARRRGHQGRRHDGQADADQVRHLDHPEHLRLSGPHRAQDLRREGRRFQSLPDRHRSVRARLLRRRPEGGLQAPRRQQVVGRRGLSRRHRVHRLRHRSGGDGQRLRSRRSPHQLRDLGRLRVDPRRARPGEVRGRHGGDDRGAHQRHQQAL